MTPNRMDLRQCFLSVAGLSPPIGPSIVLWRHEPRPIPRGLASPGLNSMLFAANGKPSEQFGLDRLIVRAISIDRIRLIEAKKQDCELPDAERV